MLELEIPGYDLYDESKNEFVAVEGGHFKFEHSLKAISKWESLYKKPFLGREHSVDELKAYYQFMSVDQKLPLELISSAVFTKLSEYINDSQTATRIQNGSDRKSQKRIITSEVIYAMMAMAQIPFSCEDWHINRLLMVLQVIGIESNPKKKKQPINEIYRSNTALNEARKQKYGTKG